MNRLTQHVAFGFAVTAYFGFLAGTARAQVGIPDPSFGNGGVQITDRDDFDQGRGVLIRPDGTILVAGYSGSESSFGTYDSMVWSHQPDGTLIQANAIQSLPFGCHVVPDFFFAMDEDSSGRVLLGGWAQYDCGGIELDFWTLRYEPGVSVEEFERPVFHGQTDVVRAILELSDNRILAAGEAYTSPGSDMAFAGFGTDGMLDAGGFGVGGETVIDVAGDSDRAFAIGEISDGRIVGVGFATIAGQRDLAIVRLNTDGTVDGTFGSGGVMTHDLGGFDDLLVSMAVLPDDSIVAAGRRGAADGIDSDFVIAKFDTDGALDPQFGVGGLAVVDFGGTAEGAMSLGLQDDGKIVVAGYSESGPGGILMRDLAVARLHHNGTLDINFGVGGKTVIDVVPGQGDLASSMALDADGDVLVAANTTDSLDFSDAVLVRLYGDINGGLIFSDGFESGDTAPWTATVP